jgi:hypothetical protein
VKLMPEEQVRTDMATVTETATARLWYRMFLAQRRRNDESLPVMRQAKSVDPFAPIVNALAMTSLLTSHQYEKLIEEASAGLKSNPNDGAQAYAQMEDIPKMLDERRSIGSWGRPCFTEKIRRKAKEEFAAVRHDYAKRGARAAQ